MVKVMYNDQLVYKVVFWALFGISLWKDKVALTPSVTFNIWKADRPVIQNIWCVLG